MHRPNMHHPNVNRPVTQVLVLFLMTILALPVAADTDSQVSLVDGGLVIERAAEVGEVSLVFLRSDGLYRAHTFAADEPVRLGGEKIAELAMPDGRYTFEARFHPVVDPSRGTQLRQEREQGLVTGQAANTVPLSGAITIADGVLLGTEEGEAGSAEPMSDESINDFVINDDLIVTGSTCIGFDCVDSETFGFDTLKLKENNTRMTFIDTSSTAGFAAGDWQLRANDSASGGADHFSIDWLGTDANVGNNDPVSTPIRVDGAAPSNALRIASTGQVGLGTATPVLNLHIATGNTPGIRFEQTAVSGFTAQTWDMASNEANFFIRDVTNGSLLPFRIRPGAPTSSIDISATGRVGIGTSSPAARLHVSNGDLRVDGAVYQLSSRALKTKFVELDPAVLLSRLAGLDLGFWRYLDKPGGASHFGPAAEDFHALFGLGQTADSIAVADLAGVALGAAQALKRELDWKNEEIASLEGQIETLNDRLMRLERLIRPAGEEE